MARSKSQNLTVKLPTGWKNRKITKEIKKIFPVMIKVLWEKNKQTQQGDRLGDFLICNSTKVGKADSHVDSV